MRKKMRYFILSCIFVLAISTICFASTDLKDIDGTKYEEAVEVLMDLGIMDGYPDGTFLPDNGVTRAEFAKLIITSYRLENAAEAVSGKSKYTDISGHWAEGYINVAHDYGFINSDSSDLFRPNDIITYTEAIEMVLRTLGYSDKEMEGSAPTKYIVKAIDIELVKNLEFKNYNDNATRGNVALLMYNMLNSKMKTVVGEDKNGNPIEEFINKMMEVKFPAYIDLNDITFDNKTLTFDMGKYWDNLNIIIDHVTYKTSQRVLKRDLTYDDYMYLYNGHGSEAYIEIENKEDLNIRKNIYFTEPFTVCIEHDGEIFEKFSDVISSKAGDIIKINISTLNNIKSVNYKFDSEESWNEVNVSNWEKNGSFQLTIPDNYSILELIMEDEFGNQSYELSYYFEYKDEDLVVKTNIQKNMSIEDVIEFEFSRKLIDDEVFVLGLEYFSDSDMGGTGINDLLVKDSDCKYHIAIKDIANKYEYANDEYDIPFSEWDSMRVGFNVVKKGEFILCSKDRMIILKNENSDYMAGKVTTVRTSSVTVEGDGQKNTYTYKDDVLNKGDVVVYTTKEKDDEAIIKVITCLTVDDNELQYVTNADGRRAKIDGKIINLDLDKTKDDYEDYMVVVVDMDGNNVDTVTTEEYADITFKDFDRVSIDDANKIFFIIKGMDERTEVENPDLDYMAGKVTTVRTSSVTVEGNGEKNTYTYKDNVLNKGDVVVYTTTEKDDEMIMKVVSKLTVDDSKLQYVTDADGRRAKIDGKIINLDLDKTKDDYEDYMVVVVDMDGNEVDTVFTEKYDDITFKDFDRVSIDDANKIFFIIKGLDERQGAVTKLKGDMNGDGKLSLIDVRLQLQKVISNDYVQDEISTLDFNGDGKVSLIDVRLLLQEVIAKG